MPTPEHQARISHVAQQVMHRISENSLRPNPAVYAVLYAHYAGIEPDVSQQITILEKDNQSLTTSICEELFNKYLSNDREKQVVEETTQKVQEVVGEILELIGHAGMSNKVYSQKLQAHTDSFSDTRNLEDIKKMISDLVADTKRMVEENKKLEERLQNSSYELQQMRNDVHDLKQETMRDTLTGVANRKAFDAELKTRAADAIDKAKPLCLVMVDIDHFKIFNDTFGHPVGDQVLRLVAHTLQEGLRATEFLARYGGEEFAILVPNAKIRDAEKMADRLRERIAAKDIVNQNKNEKLGRLSISLGISQMHPGESLSQFVDRADRALYKAKASGRNMFVSIEYDKNLHSSLQHNIKIDDAH